MKKKDELVAFVVCTKKKEPLFKVSFEEESSQVNWYMKIVSCTDKKTKLPFQIIKNSDEQIFIHLLPKSPYFEVIGVLKVQREQSNAKDTSGLKQKILSALFTICSEKFGINGGGLTTILFVKGELDERQRMLVKSRRKLQLANE